jgi:predicted nuclease of predicted toxin-antitoxin system
MPIVACGARFSLPTPARHGEGHDAVHATELSMYQCPDSEILHSAAATSRVVITADLDFPRLLAALGSTSPGLILLRGGNYSESESRDCVRRVLMSIPQTELPKSIVVVDRERIRRRWLPV